MLKAGVLGTGFMGELHCKTYANIDKAEFIGVFDIDPVRAQTMATKYSTTPYTDHSKLIADCDVLSVCVPTVFHYLYALDCIKAGKGVLIEKPIAATLDEAKEIVKMINDKSIVSAVGYIERFNPAVIELLNMLKGKEIQSIEASRLAPQANRANDVSVVFDLMIHDLDIVLSIAGSNVKTVKAQGRKVVLSVFDDVKASVEFENGVTAIIVSNKNADRKERILKITCKDCIIEADLISKNVKVTDDQPHPSVVFALGEEPIKAEILDFIKSVEKKSSPCVSGADSLKSFELAWKIEEQLS